MPARLLNGGLGGITYNMDKLFYILLVHVKSMSMQSHRREFQ